MSKLSNQESDRKLRGNLANDFLASDFFSRYLLPELDRMRMSEYPEPVEKGWQEKYRTAYAIDKAFTNLLQTINSWKVESELLTQQEKEEEKDIFKA